MVEKNKQRSCCAIANGLDLLGDRWSLLIIRDLMFTNRREFGHFLNAGEGISTNILSERLERLQQADIIRKEPHPNHGKKFVYQLTDKGIKLAPAVIEFALWGCEAIEGAGFPRVVMELANNDREKLLSMIANHEPVMELDLS